MLTASTLFVSLALAAPLPATQSGATAPSDAAQGAGDVLVVSPRDELPLTTSAAQVIVVTGEELARTGERSLPRAIGRAAGVFMLESNLGGGSPVIRGLLGNQVLIIVDGVRLNDSTTRFGPNQSLNTIDPAIVERVEVHRGSASVLYGSDAIGGVIAIWTKRRAAAGPSAAGGADAEGAGLRGAAEGLYDTATSGGRGSLELSGAGERHGWVGIVSGADWGDLIGGGGEQPFTGYHSAGGFGSFELALDPARTLRVTSWLHRDFDVPRTFQVVAGFGQTAPSFQSYDFAVQEREQTIVTLEDEEAFGIADRMNVRAFARSYREQRSRQRTGSSTHVFGETDVDTAGFAADFQRAFGAAHRLTWGVELTHDDVDSYNERTNVNTGVVTPDSGDFAPNANYGTLGVFVQDETRVLDPLLLTLGLRWSRYDFKFDTATGRERGSFDDLTASAVAAWDVSTSTRVTATVAQGFQAPNLEDLANDGDFAGGTELANPDLEPAESVTVELGADVVGETWSARAAVFGTRIDEYIGRRLIDIGDPNTSGDETYLRSNAGRLDLAGIEVGFERALGGFASPWSIAGQASWVRGRQYDDTLGGGVDARRVPPLFGDVAVRWRGALASAAPTAAPRWLDEASLRLAFAMRQDQLHPDDLTDPRIDPNGTAGWSVWTIDVGGALSRQVRWNASLVNLLDEDYRAHGAGIDGPGRSAVVTLTASF
ncbi:MAG: TonB-dependent receptor [Planctomycetota bacterium]